jgi:hypothetical protein
MPQHRSRLPILTLAGAALCAATLSWQARAATTDNFVVRSTADYVALCESTPGDDNYVAAIHFCQGFAAGAYQYYLALAQHSPSSRFVCVPSPSPTRDQAIANFLVWAHAHPERMSEPAVESMFRYLGETYPCSAAQRAPQ